MITRRLLTCVPTALVVSVALVGCGSGGSDQASGGSGSSTSSSSAAPATPTDAAGLGHLLHSAATSLRSAHLEMTVDAAGRSITARGDERLSGGTLQAMDLSEQVGTAGTVRLVVVDGKTYAQLPDSAGATSKPWVLVTTDTSNPVVARMASTMQSVQQSASVDQYSFFAQAASDVVPKGQEQVDGIATTHYSLTVDVARMPDSLPGKQALISAGLSSLPIDLWIDGRGRPVKVDEQLTVEGQSVSTVVTMSRFDEPVDISAPPADQVATD